MKQRPDIYVWVAAVLPVIWLAVLLAQSAPAGSNLIEIIENLSINISHPLSLRWTERTAAFIVAAVLCYGLGVSMYYAEQGNMRPGEEHGSAKWGSHHTINRKYMDRSDPQANIILTRHVSIGLDGHKHRRNLNTVVIGGPGTGKSQQFVIPNLLNANGSYIITDSKGELLRATGHHLIEQGYGITVLNLIDKAKSDGYNPFMYLRDSSSVLSLVGNFIRSTTPPESRSSDPFWEKAEVSLLASLILYLKSQAPIKEQTFQTLNYLIQNAGASEQDEQFRSPLDIIMQQLGMREPDNLALPFYRTFKQGTGKTAKSILITAAVRMAPFVLPELQRITAYDDMDLGSLGERKRAIFCIIPDNDPTYNFLVSLLYQQAIQELYYQADHKHGGRLPLHVRFWLDEFLNVGGLSSEEYITFLNTNRGRNISSGTILQNVSGAKSKFPKELWESVIGSSDLFLYLGGMEPSSHKLVSEMLGKATIDTRTQGISKGKNGSNSENRQRAARELMQSDEVRMLDNDYALLMIRGEPPILDRKYDITKHPYFHKSERGGAEPYVQEPKINYARFDTMFGDFDNVEIMDLDAAG